MRHFLLSMWPSGCLFNPLCQRPEGNSSRFVTKMSVCLMSTHRSICVGTHGSAVHATCESVAHVSNANTGMLQVLFCFVNSPDFVSVLLNHLLPELIAVASQLFQKDTVNSSARARWSQPAMINEKEECLQWHWDRLDEYHVLVSSRAAHECKKIINDALLSKEFWIYYCTVMRIAKGRIKMVPRSSSFLHNGWWSRYASVHGVERYISTLIYYKWRNQLCKGGCL